MMFPAAASSPFPRSRPSGPSHLSPSCARLCFHVSDRSCARPHHPTTGNAQLSSSSNSCPRDLLPASASKIPLSLVPLVWTMSQDGSQHRHHHPHYYHHLSQRRPNSLTRQSLVKHSSSGSVLSSSQSQVAVTSSSLNRKGGGGGELVTSKSTSSLSTRRHAESAERYLLDQIRSDRIISTLPNEDRRRRTIIIERKNNSFGFTLQTYGIHHKKEDVVELLTYVDRVDVLGPAFRAGLREGDVILSINGQDMEKADHRSLVKYIQSCDKTMRMVILFEDCVLKVQLHSRFLKLRRDLNLRKQEYERLCYREKQILSKLRPTPALTPGTATVNRDDGELSEGVTVISDPPSLLVSNRNWTLPRLSSHTSRVAVNPYSLCPPRQATQTGFLTGPSDDSEEMPAERSPPELDDHNLQRGTRRDQELVTKL